MFSSLAKSLFGDSNDKELKKLDARVAAITAHEEQMDAKSDEELAGMTQVFRDRLAAGETEDNLLEEAFAVVREAARRTLSQRHFDVQLMGRHGPATGLYCGNENRRGKNPCCNTCCLSERIIG